MSSTNHALPTIAILGGTGNLGPGLAMRWIKAGYTVIIGSRQAEKAETVAAELNRKLGIDRLQGMENSQAARLADVCVLTVVQSAHQAAVESLKGDLQGKILVDATARVEFRKPRPPDPPSAARKAQERLGPGVRVVAAFQNIPASRLQKNLGSAVDMDVLVCADDLEAAEVVIELIKAIGLNAYYAGNLDHSLVVEGLTSILIVMNKHYGGHSASIRITGVDENRKKD
jgi:8-hydroxy-5-deazaflavin:NADPH oxidoreductase